MEGGREAEHGNIASMGELFGSRNAMHQTQKHKLQTHKIPKLARQSDRKNGGTAGSLGKTTAPQVMVSLRSGDGGEWLHSQVKH